MSGQVGSFFRFWGDLAGASGKCWPLLLFALGLGHVGANVSMRALLFSLLMLVVLSASIDMIYHMQVG